MTMKLKPKVTSYITFKIKFCKYLHLNVIYLNIIAKDKNTMVRCH